LHRLADLIDDGLAEATKAHEAYKTRTARGPQIALSPRLQRDIGGFLPVGLTVLHGPPGSAKTALANQIAGTCGFPAMIVTCEMSPLELLHRHAARVTDTYLGKFRSGELSPATWLTLVRRTAQDMPDLAILDGQRGSVYGTDIRDALAEIATQDDHPLIVIDSLHSWLRVTGAMASASEYDAIGIALNGLQGLAAQSGAAILVIAEQNRQSMGSDRQEAAAGSRVFEYSAECVLALYRDPKVQPDADGEVPISVTIAKNRNGSTGATIDLRLAGGFMRFREGDGSGLISMTTRRKSA
jgi:replicative DNA helicase